MPRKVESEADRQIASALGSAMILFAVLGWAPPLGLVLKRRYRAAAAAFGLWLGALIFVIRALTMEDAPDLG